MAAVQTQPCLECKGEVQISGSERLNEIVEYAGCRSELEIMALVDRLASTPEPVAELTI